MADGSGTPDQLRSTYERFARFFPRENILIVTLEGFASMARETLPGLAPGNLLIEPFARKTAPCMAYAAYTLLTRDPEAVIVATPWDLYIRDEALFAQTIDEAFRYVEENDVLMTLGIVPKAPDTNFGYIQVKEGRDAHLMAGPLQVKTFTEKPSRELAEVFVYPHRRVLLEQRYLHLEGLHHLCRDGKIPPGGDGAFPRLGRAYRRACLRGKRLCGVPQGVLGLRCHGTHLPGLALPRPLRLGRY